MIETGFPVLSSGSLAIQCVFSAFVTFSATISEIPKINWPCLILVMTIFKSFFSTSFQRNKRPIRYFQKPSSLSCFICFMTHIAEGWVYYKSASYSKKHDTYWFVSVYFHETLGMEHSARIVSFRMMFVFNDHGLLHRYFRNFRWCEGLQVVKLFYWTQIADTNWKIFRNI